MRILLAAMSALALSGCITVIDPSDRAEHHTRASHMDHAAMKAAHHGGAPHASLDVRDLAPRVLNSRITAPDRASVEAEGKFYANVFGMHEIRRLDMPTYLEIFLNFGATLEEAQSNPGARIAIITSDNPVSTGSHIVVQVSNIKDALARVAASGGEVLSGPTEATTLPIIIGMIRDPAGNRIELVEYK